MEQFISKQLNESLNGELNNLFERWKDSYQDENINDKLINESYINDDYTSGDVDIVIPNDCYFAMWDNRLLSKDSRDKEVGLVNKSDIIGEVSVRLFPFKEVGLVN